MRESNVWQWVKRTKPTWIAVERIEVVYPPGLVDCFWTDKRTTISGWLELKFCRADDKELRAGRIPKLKPEQPMFLRRQAENGVPCGILLKVDDGCTYVWRAKAEREWTEQVRGRLAICMADVSWTDEPDGSEVFHALGCPCEV